MIKSIGKKKLDFIMLLTVVLTVLHTLLLINGQSLHLGRCINFPVQPDFNIEQYLGRWHTVEQYINLGTIATCFTHKYTTNDYIKRFFGEQSFLVYTTHLTTLGWTLESEIAFLKNVSEPAKYTIGTPTKDGVADPSTQVPYWILATDYQNYSLVWSCSRVTAFNLQIIRFLSRTQTPTREARQKVYTRMRQLGLNRRLLVRVPQGICPSELGRDVKNSTSRLEEEDEKLLDEELSFSQHESLNNETEFKTIKG